MSTSAAAAYGMYPRNVSLPDVVCALNQAGFENTDICMVLSPAHPDAAAVSEATILGDQPSDSANSARVIRWFSGFGAVVIPTVGFFIRSEMFFHALVAEPHAPSLSRGTGTLVGLGFPTDDAKRLAHQLCDVNAMVYVSCRKHTDTEGAIELLRNTGAREAASLAPVEAAAA
ncbi:MAG: hypothetical protein WAM79_16875 [Candidatus Sulfotelmatobacter sp.]